MSAIKEVNQFLNKTQVKKIVLQSITPIIQKIQQEIQRLTHHSQQMLIFNEKSKQIQARQTNLENSIKQFHSTMSEARQNINILKNEDKKITLSTTIQIQRVKDHLDSLLRQSNNKSEIISNYDNKLTALKSQILNNTLKNESQLQKIKSHIQKSYAETLTLIRGHSHEFKKAKDKIDLANQNLRKQHSKINQLNQSILLYASERQSIISRIQQIQDRLKLFIKKEQLITFSQEMEKKMQQHPAKVQQSIVIKPNFEDLDSVKELIRNLQAKINNFAHILQLQLQVQTIKRKIEQDQSWTKNNHASLNKMLSNIQERLNNIKQKEQQQTQQIRKKAQKECSDLSKQLLSLKTQFQAKLQQIVENNMATQQNYRQQIQKVIEQFPKYQQKLKQDLVQQVKDINQKIMDRCINIESLGENLEEKLAFFSNKLVRMKSDYDLFQANIQKDLKDLHENSNLVNIKFEDLGSIISKFTEIQLISQSLNVFKSPYQDNLVYVTAADGIISEMEKLKTGQYVFFYRKRQMALDELNKAMMISLIQLVDSIFESNQFLGWDKSKPSNFFVDFILPHYYILHEKAIKSNNNQLKIPGYQSSRLNSKQYTENQQKQTKANVPSSHRNSSLANIPQSHKKNYISQTKRAQSNHNKSLTSQIRQFQLNNNKIMFRDIRKSQSNHKKLAYPLQQYESQNSNYQLCQVQQHQYQTDQIVEITNRTKQQRGNSDIKQKPYHIKRKKLQQHNCSDNRLFATRSNRYSNHKLQ